MSDNNRSELANTNENLERDTEKTPVIPIPRPPESQEVDVNLEDAFSKIFKSSVSGTGEEELLRIASDYALQIDAKQIKCLLYLENWASKFKALAKQQPQYALLYNWQAEYLSTFVYRWLDLKRHNNSDIFVMRGLDSISLRKFINENTLKVNIEK